MTMQTSIRALAVALGLTLVAPAAIAADATVSKIDVDASVSVPEGSNAFEYYPDMTTDIQREIISRVPVTDDKDGLTVMVELKSVTLDGDGALPDSREFNEITGVVGFYDDEMSNPIKSVPIAVRAHSGDDVVPDGYVMVAPSDDDFYNAMIVGFADAVADRMPEYMRDLPSR